MSVEKPGSKKTYILNETSTTFYIYIATLYDVDGNAIGINVKRTWVDDEGVIKEKLLVKDVDYTIVGDNVEYLDAVNYSGQKLVIYRDMQSQQSMDYENNGNYNLGDIEKALDKLTLLIQQVEEEQDRNVKISIAETGNMTLPSATARANKVLGFNASGDPMAAEGITAAVTAFMKTLLDDADATTGRTTLDVYGKSETYAKSETYTQDEVDTAVEDAGRLPIGFIYMQLPNQSLPSALFGGTWSNISSSYAGDFFRAEGGNASAFESGEQGDAIRELSGWARGKQFSYCQGSTSGVFYWAYDTTYPRSDSSGDTCSYRLNFAASRQVPTAVENRVINQTIRIWKRTA